MLSRLKRFYVFNVFGKVKAVLSLGATFFILLVSFIVDNFFGNPGGVINKVIWGPALLVSIAAAINMAMNFILKKFLVVNTDNSGNGGKKYIVGFDIKSGRILFKKDSEYLFANQKGRLFLLVFVPKMEKGDLEQLAVGEIVERKTGVFSVNCGILGKELNFYFSLYYKKQYNIDELASFVFKEFSSTGQLSDYMIFLVNSLVEQAPGWMIETEDICTEGWEIYNIADIPNPESDEDLEKRIRIEFMRIANEKFHPRLLSNIARVRIGISTAKDPASELEINGRVDEEKKVRKDSN